MTKDWDYPRPAGWPRRKDDAPVTYYEKRGTRWTYPRLWREFRRCAAVAALALAQRATPHRDTRTHLMIAHLAEAMKVDGEADA